MPISNELREYIEVTLTHLADVLTTQAPLQNFTHRNYLHAVQPLSFEPEFRFREFYAQGRITNQDIKAVLAHHWTEQQSTIAEITNQNFYSTALTVDLSAISASQFTWQLEELDALNTVQVDVPESIAQCYRQSDSIYTLWTAILTKLAIEPSDLPTPSDQQNQQQTLGELDEFMAKVGDELSLCDCVLALSGKDVLEVVRPRLIRLCASVLDEGVATWHSPNAEQGFYAAWRSSTQYDMSLFLHELPDWQRIIASLPDNALDTIALHLTEMAIPTQKWAGYLQRITLDMTGWASLINWREQHPDYPSTATIKLLDYLAVRLTLDRLWLNQICHDLWKVDAKLSSLHNYFQRNISEFSVRRHLYQGDLPEYLAHQSKALIAQVDSERSHREQWQQLADLIYTEQITQQNQHTVLNSGWRLFRLSQHLGLQASDIEKLHASELRELLKRLDDFNETERAKIWLSAYEYHYQQQFFNIIHANHARGHWVVRESRPEAQLIFCLDEREESFRRHVEEHNPAIETLGAAGFFGVAMSYQAIDKVPATALCPTTITPLHKVEETPLANAQGIVERHHKGRKLSLAINNLFLHGSRTHLFLSHLIIDLAAPITLLGLLGKTFFPRLQQRVTSVISQQVSPSVPSQLRFTNSDNNAIATPENPSLGFTDREQADCVAKLLSEIGLTKVFAPLVILFGHGSTSKNNPHSAAYQCDFCAGQRSGTNARLLAAMANRPEVRHLLLERDMHIPSDTWFIGAEHDTCSEHIEWYDLNSPPLSLQSAFNKLQADIHHAQQMSAHERCRRLMSAPRNPSPESALKHVQERATDFSQLRPELAHANNTAAIIGRRALSQGVFFDRRVSLMSYDPTQDPNGEKLESILLTVVPVITATNLEYYFSTVNNERLSHASHSAQNLTGFFAVMEGISSDLCTDLPQQLTECHEATRLQLLVEAKTAVLTQIFAQQDGLRELLAGAWLHLSAKDPDSGDIYLYEHGTGFVLWQAENHDLPIYEKSPNCYKDKTETVAPALIKRPTLKTI